MRSFYKLILRFILVNDPIFLNCSLENAFSRNIIAEPINLCDDNAINSNCRENLQIKPPEENPLTVIELEKYGDEARDLPSLPEISRPRSNMCDYRLGEKYSRKSLSYQSIQMHASFQSPKCNPTEGNVANKCLNKKENNFKDKKLKLLRNISLDEQNKNNYSNLSDGRVLEERREELNKKSLGGLILNATNLSYNGFELQDPITLMSLHFDAHTPLETGNTNR